MKSLSRAVAALVAATTTSPSGAAREFFGEDLGGCFSGEYPNATAARDEFFSLLVGVGTETFESFSAGTDTPFTVDLGRGLNATLEMGNVIGATIFDSPKFGRCAISKTKYLGSPAGPLWIEFSVPVAVFGFYGTGIGDFGGGQASIETFNGVTKRFVIPHTTGNRTSPSEGNVFYFGLVDAENPFKSIQLNLPDFLGEGDQFGLDDFSAGTSEQVQLSVQPSVQPSTSKSGKSAPSKSGKSSKKSGKGSKPSGGSKEGKATKAAAAVVNYIVDDASMSLGVSDGEGPSMSFGLEEEFRFLRG